MGGDVVVEPWLALWPVLYQVWLRLGPGDGDGRTDEGK